MFKELLKYSAKPALYEKSTTSFWDDPHISRHLLEAHIDTSCDAASRKPETIDRTVAWIAEHYLSKDAAILDLGCGPGLYAERFSKLGHSVTGVDFSRRSIEYAQLSSEAKALDIHYVYQNYLTIQYRQQFDLVLLVWCDFGALTKPDQDILLKKIYTALKPGGVLVFDVHTQGIKDIEKEEQSWELSDNGFWAEGPHCVLSQNYHYLEEKVILNQNLVIREDGSSEVYNIYTHYYDQEDLAQILHKAGFVNSRYFDDILKDTKCENVLFVSTVKPESLG